MLDPRQRTTAFFQRPWVAAGAPVDPTEIVAPHIFGLQTRQPFQTTRLESAGPTVGIPPERGGSQIGGASEAAAVAATTVNGVHLPWHGTSLTETPKFPPEKAPRLGFPPKFFFVPPKRSRPPGGVVPPAVGFSCRERRAQPPKIVDPRSNNMSGLTPKGFLLLTLGPKLGGPMALFFLAAGGSSQVLTL